MSKSSHLPGNHRSRALSNISFDTEWYILFTYALLGVKCFWDLVILSSACLACGPETLMTDTPHFPWPEDKANTLLPEQLARETWVMVLSLVNGILTFGKKKEGVLLMSDNISCCLTNAISHNLEACHLTEPVKLDEWYCVLHV